MAEGLNAIKQQLMEAQAQAEKLALELVQLSKSADDVDGKRIAEVEKELEKTLNTTEQLNGVIEDTNKKISAISGQPIKSVNQELGEAEDKARGLAVEISKIKDSTDAVDVARMAELQVEFSDAAAEAAFLKQAITEADVQISNLAANSPFQKMGNQLGDVGSKLLALDFAGANASAQALLNTSKGIDFSKAVQGVKDLGGTFLKLGKALLSNPFFLIVGVIVTLGVAIYKLLDELGLVKVIMDAVGKVFEWIMKPIRALIQGLKDLTDWFGWTNNAAEDLAQSTADAAAKAAEAQEESSNKQIQALDNQIRRYKAEGKNTEDLERRKVIALSKTAKARFDEAKAAYEAAKIKGELDEKELADLAKKVRLAREASKQSKEEIVLFDIELAAEKKKIKDDANAKELDDQQKADEKARQAGQKAAADRQKDREEAAKNRLATARMIEDIELSLIEDGVEKEIKLNKVKYDRMREDTLANEKLTQSERDMLMALYDKQRVQTEDKLILDDNNKKLEVQKAFLDQLAALQVDANATRQELMDMQLASDIVALQEQVDKKLLTDEQYLILKQQLEANYAEDQAVLDAEMAERERTAKFELANTSLEDKLAILEAERMLELAQKDLTESEKLLIDEQYSEKKLALIDQEKQARMDEINQSTQYAAQGLNAVAGLADAFFANKLSKAEKGSAAELAIAKKQFEINKKIQIAQAIVQGVQATLAAYSSGSAIPVVGAVTGPVFAALAAAASILNINKIKNSKFEGGGGGGAPAVPSAAGASSAVASATSSAASSPNLSFFGSGGGGTATTPDSAEAGSGGSNMTVTAVVSEVEITSTQKRVKQYETNSEL